MSNLRKMCALILTVVFAFSSINCGGNAGTKKDEIVMWLVGSEAQAKIIMELGKDFTEETGIKVLCEAISWGNAHSKYLTSIAGDVSPDIGTMGLTWGMEFGELGAMVDLKQEYPEDVDAIGQKIFPNLLKATQVGDKVYGIPFDLSEQIMYYRTDIIKSPPRTWEQLIAVLEDLKAQNKGMLLDWGSLEWIGFSPFLWQAGGEFYNKDYSKVTLNTPEAATALSYMTLGFLKHLFRWHRECVQGTILSLYQVTGR